ncbi:MAG: DUF2975 domain-containing protein [Proteocatella sp.]
MKNYKIIFLKMAIGLIFILSIILSVLWIPKLPKVFYAVYPTIIPFFIALFKGLKLLNLIEKGEAFSNSSALCLKQISFYAFLIATFYCLASTMLLIFNYKHNFMITCISFFFASFFISVFASLLSELMENAIKIKTENDLTI